MNKAYDVHADLAPMTAWVDTRVFHNMEGEPGWTKVKLFGLACLPGRVPCFEVITPEGYIFSDVPPHLLRWKEPVGEESFPLELAHLVYLNCPSTAFALAHFPYLAERKNFAYFRGPGRYLEATYWFSLDFYRDNNWVHALRLENGQIAFLPSHKLVVPANGVLPQGHKFPDFQRLRVEFRV